MMKLKINRNLTKGPRTKIINIKNDDKSWNISKWEDNFEILNG